ncbi:1-phosphofructokinase family hexose kinase [Kitasatospora sp. NBC_01250]|uniref:1-phosphofructokinase family hexose kinase n=1 Tax=unclassified Kitasatospora TaxID=2633591 RepID=UPI002E14A8D1|nr:MULTISPECIES: 1-phosphofructokinase family hexose kinase [unclassified Kitasatospora]WSJ66444.1 1-phosphofructokinase family hexose kinase [Kitasatospora sp. NBC_01302]
MPAPDPILTVTLNTALDLTYQVPAVRLHQSNRVAQVAARAGGKGVNVARVLHRLGHPAVVTGLVGGATGGAVRADLATAGPTDALFAVRGETRRTIAVVDPLAADATLFNEPGPRITADEWTGFTAHFAALLDAGCRAAVLSGSVPPGLAPDAYATLVALARHRGVPVLLDTASPWLLPALAAGPELVKPNAEELREATGLADPMAAARALLARGAGAVVASLGAEGVLAVTPQGAWRAEPPEHLAGNPTGAGDSAVAALSVGQVDFLPWSQRLAQAVALSAATVLSPLAGGYDEAAYHALLPRVRVTRL